MEQNNNVASNIMEANNLQTNSMDNLNDSNNNISNNSNDELINQSNLIDKLAINAELKEKIKHELGSIIWTPNPAIAAAKKRKLERKQNKEKRELQRQQRKKPINKKTWADDLPSEKVCQENDVFYFIPGNKFGIFQSYGRKEGIIWLEMYKKNSFDFMTRQWSLKLDECELVERDGKLVSNKFSKDNLGYHVNETNNEVAID